MAPGTRSSKDSHAAKASNSASVAAENQRSKLATDDGKPALSADGKENSAAAQPLGPPPRPSQSGDGGPDYFSQVHNTNNPAYQAEPNPFEAQFGNPSAETPGKLLPSVAALTSPSALLPNDTPGWNSLRSGPLSPAMLAGPAGDYFDTGYSRSFPTPNESGLRTGLTPGGGGSMFPAPSPNTQAIFNGLQMGAPTPNTLEFFKTGVNARAATNGIAPTSQPSDVPNSQGMELKLPASQAPADSFAQHDADAANGLFLLAQSNGARAGNQFAVPPQSSNAVQPPTLTETIMPQTRSQKNSLGSTTLNADDSSDSDESEEAVKPATRSRGKRQPEPKSASNRRKATDTPARTPSNKRQRGNAQEKAETSSADPSPNSKGAKNMTDEEKRKNFLERNRVAALKCRQRKKQWLQNLQAKVDLYSQENDNLTHQCAQLREHVLQLRQLLMTHKDCNVTVQQGLNPQTFMAYLTSGDTINPYAPLNGVSQQMPVMMADARQVPANGTAVLPRS